MFRFPGRGAPRKQRLRRVSACLLVSFGCSSGESTQAPEDPAERTRIQAVLGELAERCFVPNYDNFRSASWELAGAANDYAEDPTEDQLDTTRAAWRTAVSAWQRTEVARGFGPAAPLRDCQGQAIAGGLDLAGQIYSWPLASACRVDAALVDESYEEPAELTSLSQPQRRGLDALEYLLFSEPLSNQCSEENRINRDGEWAALSEDELQARRIRYIVAVAEDLASLGEQMMAAWSGDDGFAQALASAGDDGSEFARSSDAVGWIAHGSLYLDSETKDRKLACPATLLAKLPDETTCPSEVEAPYGEIGTLNVQDNLAGFQEVYLGCDGGKGLLELVPVDEDGVTSDISEGISNAVDAAAKVPGEDLKAAIQDDSDAVAAAHAALSSLMNKVKQEFFGVLELDLPACSPGDAD